jgi:hypothetical protein
MFFQLSIASIALLHVRAELGQRFAGVLKEHGVMCFCVLSSVRDGVSVGCVVDSQRT